MPVQSSLGGQPRHVVIGEPAALALPVIDEVPKASEDKFIYWSGHPGFRAKRGRLIIRHLMVILLKNRPRAGSGLVANLADLHIGPWRFYPCWLADRLSVLREVRPGDAV